MAEELSETQAIADNPAPPTFENVLCAMEKSGRLLPERQPLSSGSPRRIQSRVTESADRGGPELAAHQDASTSTPKLFARVAAVYKQRESLKHRSGSVSFLMSLTIGHPLWRQTSPTPTNRVEEVERGNLDISTAFSTKLLAATRTGAYVTRTRVRLPE